jgi:ACS family tartrate transporter-like MFS transporter
MVAMSQTERALAAIRRHLLPFLFLLYVVAYLDRVNVSFAAADVSRDLGLNSASYGFAAGIFFVGYVLFEVPSNLILDRVGARRWVSRILFSWGLVAALMAFMTSATQFNVLRLLLGVAEAGFFPGIVLYLSQWVPVQQRASTLAGFMLAIPMAGLLGGPISAVLLSLHGLGGLAGWRWLFLMEAIPALVLSVLVWRHLPNHPREARWLEPEAAEALEQVLADERAGMRRSGRQIHGLVAGLREPKLWLLSLLYVGIATGFYGFSFWIPRFVAEALPLAQPSAVLVNLISAIPYGLAVLAMLLVGGSADRHQEHRLHVALPLAVAALCLGLAIASDGLLRLTWISLSTAAAFSCLGPFWAIPARFLGGRAAAAGIASINSVGNIGGFLAPIVMGRLMLQANGNALALTSLAGMLLLSAVLALLLPRTLTLPSGADQSDPAPSPSPRRG